MPRNNNNGNTQKYLGDLDGPQQPQYFDEDDAAANGGDITETVQYNEDGEQETLGFLTSFQWIPHGFINPRSLHLNAEAVHTGASNSTEQQKNKLGRRMGLTEEELKQLNDELVDQDGAPSGNNNNDDDDQQQQQQNQTQSSSNKNSKKSSSKTLRVAKSSSRNAALGIDQDDAYFIGGGTDNILQEIESDDGSEIDDTTIRDTDLVFIVSRAGEDPTIEVTIYDEPKDNIYVHHDAQIVAPPLCVEWMFHQEHRTSLCAIGTMHPYIEIWNIDHSDAVDPAAILGGCKNPGDNYLRTTFKKGTGKPSKVAKEGGLMRDDSHTDAVTALKWNGAVAPTILASGSADSIVKVWDLEQLSCLGTMTHPAAAQKGRVQSLDWHPTDPNVLLTSCGAALDILDCRTPDSSVVSWNCSQQNSNNINTNKNNNASGGDSIEKAMYLPVDSNFVLASTSVTGTLALFDIRKGSSSSPVWALGPNLHSGELIFAVSKHEPLLATAGKQDGISLWQFNPDSFSASAPQRLSHRRLKVGQCFSLQFHPNSPDVLGACGTAGLPLVYTIANDVKYGRKIANGEEIPQDEMDELLGRNLPEKRKKKRHGRGGMRGGGFGGRGSGSGRGYGGGY